MEPFPKLKNDQVALLFADVKTGIVLDQNHNYHLNKFDQIAFIIFESHDKALQYANIITDKRQDIEFVIYDKNQQCLTFSNPAK